MKNRKKLVSILALIMAVVMILSLILSLIPQASAASSSEIRGQINELKDQKEELRSQMADLQNQYEENENEIAGIVAKKNIIDQEIFLLYSEIDNINQQISAFNVLIADKQDELDEAQARLNALSDAYRERIRAMEEEGSISYWSVLFNASSLSDLLDRLNMIQEIAASDQRRLKELDEAAKEVEHARTALETEKSELQDTRDELDATYAELGVKQQEAEGMIVQLLEKSAELSELYEGFELEEEALMAQIAAKEKEYNDAKYQEWLAYIATATTAPPETTSAPEPTEASKPENGGTTEPGQTTPPETQAPAAATWQRPCSYTKMTSPFGKREQPTAGASTYHQGVDLAGPAGTPIYAARAGTVTAATRSNSAGYYVTINHGDGYSSIYMHMTNFVVSSGQTVSQGQLIGYMGSTGISTGPHLHFGIAYNGAYVNPAQFVSLY